MEPLERYVHALKRRRGDLAFVVLFGSRARGDWAPGSDYDVLVGLDGEDDRRFLDRLAAFEPDEPCAIEVFPYARSEWERMAETFHPLLLDALAEGVVLHDDGTFAALRARFDTWRREGLVQPWRKGWRVAPEQPAQPMTSP